MPLVKFAPFGATIHPSFWQQLASVKIDRLQLSEDAIPIRAEYSTGKSILDRQTGEQVSLGCNIAVDGSSFNEQSSATANLVAFANGRLQNLNTIEEFKKVDKQAVFDQTLQEIWTSIRSSDDPTEKLTNFLVLTFADLKKYRFYYWFAFPALTAKPGWEVDEHVEGSWMQLALSLGDAKASSISTALTKRVEDGSRCDFFLVKFIGDKAQVAGVAEYAHFFDGVDSEERYVGFTDPSASPDAPGWPLRNFLAMLHVRFGVSGIKVICWKDEIRASGPALDGDQLRALRSTVGRVYLPFPADSTAEGTISVAGKTYFLAAQPSRPEAPSGVGWERNAQGKLAPKVADLGPLMDPKLLADQAVDLNLKLMRWRIMPDIQLEKIQTTKCLLLGAGTLGCYVARTLLGWGVRHITFVDSSKVSFSNPVRQPLFEFEDCLDGGKPKAQCAADQLKKIYPGVNSAGHMLNIPMPGHPVPPTTAEQVKRDVVKLEELFDEHDVVYLLMDSRESRWLPTVMGAAKGKLVINAALGFDTYLVMRHGAPPSASSSAEEEEAKPPSHRRLGCYFCNDVVAPTDSLTDRTLDQMCTVTRPGLAAIAGASAVELMVSVLQHERGIRAPAAQTPADRNAVSSSLDASTVLGVIPHQLRGFLAQFNNMLIIGQAYDRCTGCSATVVEAYQQRGFEMLLRAFNDDKYLESLTGLDKMYAEAEEMEAALDWEEDEDDEGDL